MATKGSKPRTRKASTAKPAASVTAPSAHGDGAPPAAPERGTELIELVGLAFAMILGAVGFFFNVLWVGSIVVMGILLGVSIAGQRNPRRNGGVASGVVGAVVEEARNIGQAASGTRADGTAPKGDQDN